MFTGYICCSEIVRAVADVPAGPYVFQEVVLPERGAAFWDGRMTHNPTIHRVGATYLLFYIGSTYDGAAPRSAALSRDDPRVVQSYAGIRIGLATAASVLGPWHRQDRPILEPRPGKWDHAIVTNPAPCVLRDGRILLLYRSNTPQGLRIGAAMADDYRGPFGRLQDEPVLQFSGGNHAEDPFVWQEGDHFEMIAKDMTGGVTGEMHAGLRAVSADGRQWELADPPKAYSRRIRWSDGRVTEQGCLERPQLLFERGIPTHLFAATADGPGGFHQCTRTWNMVIPLA
jgi:hypothetical protein